MKFYIGDAGAKSPGIAALIRLVIWNIEENEQLYQLTGYVKDVDCDGRGIYIELDHRGSLEPEIPEKLLPTVFKQLTKKIARQIPSCVEGIMKSADEEGFEDPRSYLEGIVNGGDEESGLFPVENSNYELGDEKTAVDLLNRAAEMRLSEALDVLRRSGLKTVKTNSR